MISRRSLVLAGTSLPLVAAAPFAFAQATTFPRRPVLWVVPYPAGGFGDAVSRVLAQHMASTLKQPVVVENKPGAGGQIAAAHVKQQPADGHTLLYGDIGPFAMNAALYPKLNYNTLKDFTPITRLLTSSLLLVVPPNSPYKSVDDLIKDAKTRKDDRAITYGSYGIGSQPHIWMEMLKRETKASLQHVAYKGAAPAVQDLMGGHIEVMLDVAANSLPYVQEGKLRALAVVGAEKRLERLPQVPTLSELGYPNLNAPGWTGVVVKAGTPPDIAAQLRSAVVQAVESEEIRRRFGDLGVTPAPQTPQDFARFIESETKRWGSVIRSAGVVLE
ncbi:Bug family tripartite tricarboxylate transporter substrate binding protein [Comamonas testosteroni]|uniref:Bug family tripartite tricarboxylate transporter substrate binding protein n=1 Tax=Comamonas testosteroni TaxID=285 RepID=UPI0005B469F1|nr:tripartite tricarboxylate transporter substrate binding protein [Comamonas testosteroni]